MQTMQKPLLQTMQRQIALTDTIDDIEKVRIVRDDAIEVERMAVRIRLRAERRIGQLLKKKG